MSFLVLSGDGEDPVSSPEIRPGEGAAGDKTQGRTKRIRTCFRREQLRTMESYFALKHNPNGKDWSSLSYKTGLPKRVLQVGDDYNQLCHINVPGHMFAVSYF